MRRVIVLFVAVLAALGASACSSAGADGARAPVAEEGEGARTLIDVRTPEEFAEGHLEGAELLDATAPDFDRRVGELDPDGTYDVYCRSGNRSAQAVAAMRAAGIDDVVDLGGVDAAAASTGRPLVTG